MRHRGLDEEADATPSVATGIEISLTVGTLPIVEPTLATTQWPHRR